MSDNPKILVADDERDFTAALQVTLEGEGYRVITVSNRVQAQEAALAEWPDMVIVGTIMPRGDAFLLYQWLKGTPALSDLPILVIDARPEKRLLKGWRREEGLQMETEDFLAKPIEPRSLLPRIANLVAKATKDKAARKIRVLVVDDHAIIRDGIRAVLSLQGDVQVVGEAVDGRDALDKALQLSPDVVLMDIVMPVMNGLEATKQICKECKNTQVLILSQYDDEENVLASNQAGALGFIPKKSASSHLLAGIRSVSHGKRFVHSLNV